MKVVLFYDATPETQPLEPELKVALDITEDVKRIYKCLVDIGLQVEVVGLDYNVLKSLQQIKSINPDLIFNLCEGFGEESSMESRIAGSLELMSFPLTGAGSRSLSLCHDKSLAKKVMRAHQIPTPDYLCIEQGEKIESCPIGFPVIVKPVQEDGSLGVEEDAVVYTLEAIQKRVKAIHKIFRQSALIEAFIDGREINLSLLGNDPFDFVNLREVKFLEGYKIVSFSGKWKESSRAFQSTPVVNDVDLDARSVKELVHLAKRVFHIFELRDYGRLDIRLNQKGEPFVIDVNPNPCISYDSGIALAAEEEGYDYVKFISRIVECARERTEKKNQNIKSCSTG